MNLRKFFLTVGFSGLSPLAPGTMGSIVALILGLLLLQFLHPSTLFLLSILITVIAVKQINIYEEQVKQHDSKEIVIDELVGMWIALSIVDLNESNYIYMAILAFLGFRLFDIWKPSIIGRIDEKVSGGWGVMLDDVIAGIAGGICAALVFQVIEIYIFPIIK